MISVNKMVPTTGADHNIRWSNHREAPAEPGEDDLHRPALRPGGDGGEIVDKSIALAHGLRARGYKEGDVACVFSFNVPEFAIAVYGSALAGMTVMLCNALYSYYELQHQLIDSSSVLLFIPGNWGHLIISNDDYWADYNHWSGHFQAMASVAKRSE